MRKILATGIALFCIMGAGMIYHNHMNFEKSKTEAGARELTLVYFLKSVENTRQPDLISLSDQAQCETTPTLLGDSDLFRFVVSCQIPTTCSDPIEMPVYVMIDGRVGNPSGSVSQALLSRCPTMIENVDDLRLPDNWQQGG